MLSFLLLILQKMNMWIYNFVYLYICLFLQTWSVQCRSNASFNDQLWGVSLWQHEKLMIREQNNLKSVIHILKVCGVPQVFLPSSVDIHFQLLYLWHAICFVTDPSWWMWVGNLNKLPHSDACASSIQAWSYDVWNLFLGRACVASKTKQIQLHIFSLSTIILWLTVFFF